MICTTCPFIFLRGTQSNLRFPKKMSRSSWMKNAKWSIWSWGENGAHAESRFEGKTTKRRPCAYLLSQPGKKKSNALCFAFAWLFFTFLFFASAAFISCAREREKGNVSNRSSSRKFGGRRKKKKPKRKKEQEWQWMESAKQMPKITFVPPVNHYTRARARAPV